MNRPPLTRGMARIRLAEAFVEESTRLLNARPAWCQLMGANEVEQYARNSIGALRSVESSFHHGVAACEGHAMHTYANPNELASTVAAYLGRGLMAGEGVLAVVHPRHWSLIAAQLATLGFAPHEMEGRGQIVTLDCRLTLNAIMRDGVSLDPVRFAEVIGGAISMARARYPRLRLFGEMVNDLWERGRDDLALELEQLWNVLLAGQKLPLHCAYSAPTSDVARQAMAKIEQQHTAQAA